MWSPRLGLRSGLRRQLTRLALGGVTHVSTDERVAALTFDDGPHREFTLRLLRVLEAHGARATFFMVGKAAQQHPDVVRQVAQEGHVIGNHSWDHPSFPLISGRERRAQIRACARALSPYGRGLFRPPYGHLAVAGRLDVLWLRYRVIAWSVVAEDWLDHDAATMADRMYSGLRPGSIIALHDALYHALEERYADRRPMIQAVDQLLGRLGRTYRFVTVPELLQVGRPQWRRWHATVNIEYLNSLKAIEGAPRRYLRSASGPQA